MGDENQVRVWAVGWVSDVPEVPENLGDALSDAGDGFHSGGQRDSAMGGICAPDLFITGSWAFI